MAASMSERSVVSSASIVALPEKKTMPMCTSDSESWNCDVRDIASDFISSLNGRIEPERSSTKTMSITSAQSERGEVGWDGGRGGRA